MNIMKNYSSYSALTDSISILCAFILKWYMHTVTNAYCRYITYARICYSRLRELKKCLVFSTFSLVLKGWYLIIFINDRRVICIFNYFSIKNAL